MTPTDPPLKQASRFSAADFQTLQPAQSEPLQLQAAVRYDDSAFEQAEPVVSAEHQQTDRSLWYWAGALACALLLAGWQWADFISASWQASLWQGGAVTALTGFVAVLVGRVALTEWRLWRQLRQRQHWRQAAERLQASVQFGEALPLCQQIRAAMPAGTATETLWQQFLTQHQAQFSDAETLRLFEQTVVQAADSRVQQQIRQAAMQTGVAVAMSPFALADMLLVLWRASLMLREIASLYGCSVGRLRSVRLLKKFVQTLFFTGASEMAVDLGSDFVGAELTGKLSARLGQGVLAAVLVARLGKFAQQELRPLPLTVSEPGLIRQVMQDLLTKFTSGKTAN
jgi:putative membrane protein